MDLSAGKVVLESFIYRQVHEVKMRECRGILLQSREGFLAT
jgi:hypothetical protein